MKDVYEVLRQKEREAERVRQEILALRLATPLLADTPAPATGPSAAPAPPSGEQVGQWKEALRVAAPLLADPEDDLISTLRARTGTEAAKGKWKPSLALKLIGFSPFRP
ncbi:MAG: hypothetical protein ACM3PW_03535 [Chlamydiota bacterium]